MATWRQQLEHALRLADPDPDPAPFDDRGPDELAGVGPWAAPGRAIAVAAASHAGRQNAAPRLVFMVDSLARVTQIHADLATLHTDLERGRITYPINVIARVAGIPLRRPLPVMEFLGAMVVTGALGMILDHASERLDACRGAAADVRLPTVASYLADVDRMLQDIRSSLPRVSRDLSASGQRARTVPLFQRHEAALPKALDMAERYLLADPTFAESWETHREGLFGVPEVASRFPAGLILEILCANGRAISSHIDDFVSAAARDDFRYYTHPDCDMDSDTLGVVLRLLPHARAADGDLLPTVQRALRCVESIVARTGRVPVWVTGCEHRPAALPLLRLGEGCATVEAHFLLGLIGFAFEQHGATIARAASHLLDRVTTVGLGANVNYPPLYALGTLLRLTASLSARSVPPDLQPRLVNGRATLIDKLERSSAMAELSPQDAALLIGACYHASEPNLLRPRWVDIVLKAQRSDGRWSAEPFVPSPTRGRSVTWYASTTMTTALCYDALARWSRSAP